MSDKKRAEEQKMQRNVFNFTWQVTDCAEIDLSWRFAALSPLVSPRHNKVHLYSFSVSPLTFLSLTQDGDGVVLSFSQHPDRVSDEVMV